MHPGSRATCDVRHSLSDINNLFRSLALSLSLVAGFAHALAAEPVAGKNYEVLKLPQPTSAPPGKVEVIELFYYTSPGCYELELTIEAFVKEEGDRILFKRVAFQSRCGFAPLETLLLAGLSSASRRNSGCGV